MKLTPKNKAGEIKNLKQIGDDKHSFNVEWKGKKLNWNLIGRALYKIGLGMVAFKEGRERACESKFDPAREFIQTGRGIENNLEVRTKFQPHPSIQTLYLDLPEGTPVFIDLFGLAFLKSHGRISPQISSLIEDSKGSKISITSKTFAASCT